MPVKALLTLLLFAASLVIGLVFLSLPEAEAARLGGGRSFGSRPAMQRPATPPAQRQPAAGNSAAATAQGQAAKSGLLGGMGGMLGGLLAGTLIGSLLFGGGFQGGGLVDLLLIALLAFLAFKLFAKLRGGAGVPAGAMRQATAPAGAGGAAWENFEESIPASNGSSAAPSVPAGFDTEEFLRGAKLAFNRLQKSWDARNLKDIAMFTTPVVLQEIEAQMRQSPDPGHTEILLTNAQLVDVQNAGDTQTASVFFDTLLREDPGSDTTQVREIWHFVRPLNGTDSWRLDGIQQVE